MIAGFLRHGSNTLLIALVVGLAALLASSRAGFSAIALVIGAVVFFISEYTTHRFLFHAKPSRVPFVLRLQHRLHYDHHTDPSKLELLFLPAWFVLPTAALYLIVAFALTHNIGTSVCALSGSLAAMLYYEWVHYVAHVPFVPRTPLGKYMKKYHLWHHFKNEHLWYGVTNPSVDLVVGTYRRVEDAERSGSTRELF
ncbi:MAG: sterol desaturase family protein [Vulcanimicrobiaceae bacterium]